MNKVISLLVVAVCFLGCVPREDVAPSHQVQESDFARQARNLYGDYKLINVLWTGCQTDLNGDGVYGWNLLDEMKDKIGYWEPNHLSNVCEGEIVQSYEPWSRYALSFNLTLPYPYLVERDGGEVVCSSVGYFKKTLRVEDLRVKQNGARATIGYYDSSNIFLNGLKWLEVYVDSFDDDSFKIIAQCSLPCDELGLQESSIVYTFRKVK
ncbi:MAG: hypothetical protein MJZ07_08010 [Bacteroidales bacterium]|nr:hypothetical protein [Bacteroidales bacterium]